MPVRAREEGLEPSLLALDLAQLVAKAIDDLGLGEVATRESQARAEQGRRRRREVLLVRVVVDGYGLGQRERAIGEREVLV